ncbi:MAG TPA: sugar ABC transporter permease, partial [Anaerolineales bacterium]|nr:sugar ABC transporter permease [Anaerolineales bacterium]
MTTSAPAQTPRTSLLSPLTAGPLRVLVSLIVPLITFLALRWAFIFMRSAEANKLLVGIVALIIGVGGVWALYLVTDNLVSLLPEGVRETVRPFVFVGPALVILTAYLVYPVLRTVYLSFLDARSREFVGLDNYAFALTSSDMLIALRNNVLWLIFVTGFVVSLGLVIAVMVDRIGRLEPIAKSFIFVPMAISAVGASVIWRFVYSFQPIQRPQIGLLNAVFTALGGDP